MKNSEHPQGGYYKFILMALLKEGPLTLKELEEKTFTLAYHFHGVGYSLHELVEKKVFSYISGFGHQIPEDHSRKMKKSREKYEERLDPGLECNDLVIKGMLRLNEDDKYELTNKGKIEAEKSVKGIKKASNLTERQLLSPKAAARNTIIADLFLAIIKLSAGLLSGSVGLIADGADAAIDTFSALVVWVSIKFNKELLGTLIITLMMFVTAFSVGYESISKIIMAITATITPLSMPYIVILVEGVSMIAAGILYFYQRYVGKRNGSLSLISQSIDSKNHVYVASAVIIGATFSIFGIYFADAVIGAFIALRILLDGFDLSKEALSSIKGEKTDFSKYEIPFEKHWHMGKLETFRTWILYSISENNVNTRAELVHSLEKTFQPEYIPILSEFRLNLGKGFDFEKEFNNLIEPLIDEKLLTPKDDELLLTEKGKKHVNRIFKSFRYHNIK
jgi:cation diffusion facilitator family transporter